MVFGYRACYLSLRFKLTEVWSGTTRKFCSLSHFDPRFFTLSSLQFDTDIHSWCVRMLDVLAKERKKHVFTQRRLHRPRQPSRARASERELMDCGADGHSGLFVYVWAVKIWLHLQVATPAAWRLCLSRRQWWVCVGISDAVRLDGESEFGSMCCWTWDVFVFFLVVCGRALFVLGILVLRSTSAKFTIHLYSWKGV